MVHYLFIAFLLFSGIAHAGGASSVVMSGKGPVEEGGAASYFLYWNPNDCGTQEDADSASGSCDITGTRSGATIVDNGSDDYLSVTASNNLLRWSTPADFDVDSHYGRMIVEPQAVTGNCPFFENDEDSSNHILIWRNSSGELIARHEGGGTMVVNEGNDNSIEQIVNGYKNVIEWKVDVSTNDLSIRVCSTAGADTSACGGSEPWDSTKDVGSTLATATEKTTLAIGEDTSSLFDDSVYIYELELRTYANAP